MLCYRCGGHVRDGADKCPSCGQPFAPGLKPGSIAGFGTGSRRGRAAVEGAPYKIDDAVGARFLIKDHLGAGPLGWNFRAVDTESGESVCIKVLAPRFLQLPEEQAAFTSEMERTRAIDHANIARSVAAGIDGARPWIATQLLEGLTLRRIMDLRRQKGQAFALLEVEPIIAQIAAALDASAVAHGDLKPDNVVVLPDLLKLTDFGLALCLPRAPFIAAQRAGGVQRYFAPEILGGQALGGRADVFSLGVMLGEMLGGAPFDSQLEARIRTAEVPKEVEEVFLRAVAPRPEDRFASAGDLSIALSEALNGPAEIDVEEAEILDDDDVEIEHAQTDPRVRIARALASQDAERTARNLAKAAGAKKAAEAKIAPELPSSPPLSLSSLPPLSVPPLAMPPLGLRPFSAPPPITAQPQPLPFAEKKAESANGWFASPDSVVTKRPTKEEPAAPPPPAAPALEAPAQSIAAEGARGHATPEEIARVAASVGATPELLTAETAVRFAPTAPVPAPAPPAPPAPVAAKDPEPLVQPDEAQPADEGLVEIEDVEELGLEEIPNAPLASTPPPASDPPSASKRRGRGRKGRAENGRGRRSLEGPSANGFAAAAMTNGVAHLDLHAAANAETMEMTPLAARTVALPALEKPAPIAFEKPIPLTFEKPAELPAARKPISQPPSAAPAFGAIAPAKRKPSVPLLLIGAVAAVVIGLLVWNQLASRPIEKKQEAPAPAEKVETSPARPPAAPAPVSPASAETEPPKEVPPAATEAPPARAEVSIAREISPTRELDEKATRSTKKSFLERLRERREASKHSNEAARTSAKSSANSEAAAPAPPAPANGGGIAVGDGGLAARDEKRKGAEVAMAAPAAAAAATSCPEGMKAIPGGAAHIGTDASDDMRNFGDRSLSTVQLKPYCIDVYEWPNAAGKAPKVAAGFSEADASCKKAGKRLCSEDEWEKACKGPSDLRFPYGSAFNADLCNTQDKDTNPRKVDASGKFTSCRSGYGVYDLSGNAAEWTASAFEGAGGDRAVKGGSATRPGFDDRCSSRRRLATSAHDINVGFRCCVDSH